jgi:hypothetical protein
MRQLWLAFISLCAASVIAVAAEPYLFGVIFAPNRTQAWGGIRIDGEAIIYLGAPSPARQAVLKDALQ